MPRLTDGTRHLDLGYSTNVHRAERLRDVYTYLDAITVPVRERLDVDRMGIDLRLGKSLADRLASPDARRALRDGLDERGLYTFGINAFPLGDFQAERVKDDVYRPDWRDPQRLAATLAIAEIGCDLVDEGQSLAISTVAGGYRPHGDTPEIRDRMARHLVDAAVALAQLADARGRHLTLAPEPEPDTTMDDRASTVAFYADHVLPAAERRGADALDAVRTHLPVTLDACHLSVAFETPADTVDALSGVGVAVGKANVSCCPRIVDPSTNVAGRRFLAALDEPRFLHQTWGRAHDGSVALRLADLVGFADLDATTLDALDEIRSHFHLPLFGAGGPGFRTTRDETADFLGVLVERTPCTAFAVETYTWHVFPDTPLVGAFGTDVVQGLTLELEWALERLAELGFTPVDAEAA